MTDPYFGYIAAAYGVTGVTLAWVIVAVWWHGRRRARRLRELGDG